MFWKKDKPEAKIGIGDLSGIQITEKKLIELLQPYFKNRIRNITTRGNSFEINHDPGAIPNSVTWGQEDMVALFKRYTERNVVQVISAPYGHEHYLILFEE